MTDYTKLDAAILALVSCRAIAFPAIVGNASVKAQLKPLVDADPKKPAFRFIDNRLQALRKRGAIKYSRNAGWSAVAPKDADKTQAAL